MELSFTPDSSQKMFCLDRSRFTIITIWNAPIRVLATGANTGLDHSAHMYDFDIFVTFEFACSPCYIKKKCSYVVQITIKSIKISITYNRHTRYLVSI